MSLSIEVTQILLDLPINANRVFEIDDLWTNTLGLSGLAAFQLGQKICKIVKATLGKRLRRERFDLEKIKFFLTRKGKGP